MPITLDQALAVVNSHRRRPVDPPLLVKAVCSMCGEAFAMQPQDFSRAQVHGHDTVCRLDSAEHRRNKKK